MFLFCGKYFWYSLKDKMKSRKQNWFILFIIKPISSPSTCLIQTIIGQFFQILHRHTLGLAGRVLSCFNQKWFEDVDFWHLNFYQNF